MRTAVLSESPPLGLKVLYCLAMAGHVVDVISLRVGNPIKRSRYRDSYIEIPRGDLHYQAGWLADRCRRRAIEVVVADSIGAAGRLHGMQRDLPEGLAYTPEPKARLERIHDKWAFYKDFHQSVNMPRTILLSSIAELHDAPVSELGSPFLVKPLNGESGHGIQAMHTLSDLHAYLESPGPYKTFPLALQEYIPGEDLGFSVLANNGEVIAWDTQRRDEEDVREFAPFEAARAIGFDLVRQMGYSGPAHVDMRRDQTTGTVYVLECNCRFWFTLTANAWSGMNYPDLAVRLHRGTYPSQCPDSPPQGTYFLPGTVVRRMRRPWVLARLKRANWRGFWQAVTDPLPHLR